MRFVAWLTTLTVLLCTLWGATSQDYGDDDYNVSNGDTNSNTCPDVSFTTDKVVYGSCCDGCGPVVKDCYFAIMALLKSCTLNGNCGDGHTYSGPAPLIGRRGQLLQSYGSCNVNMLNSQGLQKQPEAIGMNTVIAAGLEFLDGAGNCADGTVTIAAGTPWEQVMEFSGLPARRRKLRGLAGQSLEFPILAVNRTHEALNHGRKLKGPPASINNNWPNGAGNMYYIGTLAYIALAVLNQNQPGNGAPTLAFWVSEVEDPHNPTGLTIDPHTIAGMTRNLRSGCAAQGPNLGPIRAYGNPPAPNPAFGNCRIMTAAGMTRMPENVPGLVDGGWGFIRNVGYTGPFGGNLLGPNNIRVIDGLAPQANIFDAAIRFAQMRWANANYPSRFVAIVRYGVPGDVGQSQPVFSVYVQLQAPQ